MNSEKTLTSLVNLEIDLEKQFFKKTVFLNETLENMFQEYRDQYSLKDEFISNVINILGFLGTLMFILVSFFNIINFVICLTVFIISLLTSSISMYHSNKRLKLYNDHFQIFLSFINLSILCIVISLYNKKQDISNENIFLRIIIYQCFSNNISMLTKLEANVFNSFFYMIFNLITILISILSSGKCYYYGLESAINISAYLIFFLLRKAWDSKLRRLFYEKYKFESFYIYTVDYLNSLNGYTLNIKNNNFTIFHNDKINLLVDSIIKDRDKDYLNQILINKSINHNQRNENKKIESCLNYNKEENSEFYNNKKKSGKIITFLKSLTF